MWQIDVLFYIIPMKNTACLLYASWTTILSYKMSPPKKKKRNVPLMVYVDFGYW